MEDRSEYPGVERHTQVEKTIEFLEQRRANHPIKFRLESVLSFGMAHERMVLEAAVIDGLINEALSEREGIDS